MPGGQCAELHGVPAQSRTDRGTSSDAAPTDLQGAVHDRPVAEPGEEIRRAVKVEEDERLDGAADAQIQLYDRPRLKVDDNRRKVVPEGEKGEEALLFPGGPVWRLGRSRRRSVCEPQCRGLGREVEGGEEGEDGRFAGKEEDPVVRGHDRQTGAARTRADDARLTGGRPQHRRRSQGAKDDLGREDLDKEHADSGNEDAGRGAVDEVELEDLLNVLVAGDLEDPRVADRGRE